MQVPGAAIQLPWLSVPLKEKNVCRGILVEGSILQIATMSRTLADSSDEYEFIETPAAPSPTLPVENCGVRTTSVRYVELHTRLEIDKP